MPSQISKLPQNAFGNWGEDRFFKFKNNRLLFFNRTSADIIFKEEFEELLGDHFINTLTQEKLNDFHFARIDKAFLKNTSKISPFIFTSAGKERWKKK